MIIYCCIHKCIDITARIWVYESELSHDLHAHELANKMPSFDEWGPAFPVQDHSLVGIQTLTT